MPQIIGRRAVRNRRSRRINPTLQNGTPIGVASVAKATNVMTIAFNQAVALDGVPKYTTNLAGVTAVSAVQTAPNTVAVTFSAAVATATALNIPHDDPAIRNASGGYVVPTSFPA